MLGAIVKGLKGVLNGLNRTVHKDLRICCDVVLVVKVCHVNLTQVKNIYWDTLCINLIVRITEKCSSSETRNHFVDVVVRSLLEIESLAVELQVVVAAMEIYAINGIETPSLFSKNGISV